MKGSDELIDCVLEALRNTETDPGLEQRITQRVTQRMAEKIESRTMQRALQTRLWWWLIAKQQSLAIRAGAMASLSALSVAALVFGLFLVSARHRPPSAPVRSEVRPAGAQPVVVDASVAEARTAHRLAAPAIHTSERQRGDSVPNTGSAGTDLAHAASMVAPALPLTEQERLLVRVAHRGQPEVYALLDPGNLARQEAENKNAFIAFFEPPRPLLAAK